MENAQNMDFVPASTAVATNKPGALVSLFGQFATREFWKSLVSLVLKEAVSAFILSLGGSLIYYIKGKSNQDSNNIRNLAGVAGNPQSTTSPNQAFSNGYQPSPSYRPAGYQQPANTQQPLYPGFGS
jgi:hypothetical protein